MPKFINHWMYCQLDIMSSKSLIIAVVAIVVVAAGAGAFVVLSNNNGSSNEKAADVAGSYGLVYGNADGDTKFSDADLNIIKKVMDTPSLLKDYPLADADNNGTVEQADYDFVKSLVDGTQPADATVKVIDALKNVVTVPFPLKSIFFFGQVNGRTVANVLDLQDNIVCLATNDTYLNDIDKELMSVTNAEGFSGKIPRLTSNANETDISDLSKTTFQAAILEESGMGGYNGDAARSFYDSIGAKVLQFNFDSATTSLQSVATIGILVQKSDKAANYIDLVEDVTDTIKNKTGSKFGTATVLSVVMSNSVSGTPSDYYAATVLAGGKNIADWTTSTKKFNPSNGDTWLYESKYNANYMIHFKSMAGHTLDMDAETIKDNLKEYSAYFSETTMFKNGGYYLLNGLIPLPARLAYMAEVMYTDSVGKGYGATVFQDFVDSFTDLKDWKAADHTVMWSFKEGSGYVPAKSVTLSEESLTLGLSNSAQLTYTINDGATDTTPIWTSDNTSVATVSLGKITALAAGIATITISIGDATDTCTVTVQDVNATEIQLSKDAVSLGKDGKATLTYTITPSNASIDSFSLTSSDDSIVAVGDGVVIAKAIGVATITASVGDVSDTCVVTVSDKAVTGITWTEGQTVSKGVVQDYKTMRGTSSYDYEFVFTVAPEAANVDDLAVTSSNDSIVKVVSFDECDGKVTVVLKRVDDTTAEVVNITVSAGDQSCIAKCKCNGAK